MTEKDINKKDEFCCEEHDCNDEDCCCGHDHEEVEKIFLTLDDGSELECTVLAFLEMKDKQYVALLPEDDERVLLYEFRENEENIELINIEDDEEFELVSQAFMELFGETDGEDEEY